jgi:hypothetical protein
MKRGLFTVIGLIFALAAIAVVGIYLIEDDPFNTWAYFMLIAIAADQIKTTVWIKAKHSDQQVGGQEFTMGIVASIWATLYLPPVHAIIATAIAFAVSNLLLAWEKPWYKRLLNWLMLSVSSIAMIGTYYLLTDFWATTWPSFAAGVAALVGAFVYDLVNVSIMAIPMRKSMGMSWRDTYEEWVSYIYFPILTAVGAVACSLLIDSTQWGIAIVAFLVIMFFKPSYTLRSLRGKDSLRATS